MTRQPAVRLGLGSAQFGLDYGVTNLRGQTTPADVAELLRIAGHAGVRVIDTAPAYGSSEETIGACLPSEHHFRIVTKTPVFECKRIGQSEVRILVAHPDWAAALPRPSAPVSAAPPDGP